MRVTDNDGVDFHIRERPGVREAVQKLARSEDRSVSSMLRVLLREALAARNAMPAGRPAA